MEGDRGRETGGKGDGRCMGRGRRGGGKREKKGKLRYLAQYFSIKKCKEAGANKYRAGTGIKGYGKQEV